MKRGRFSSDAHDAHQSGPAFDPGQAGNASVFSSQKYQGESYFERDVLPSTGSLLSGIMGTRAFHDSQCGSRKKLSRV
jgi:hypothetical protein